MGRDVRESLWKGAKALLRGSGLEISVCAACWKGWRLAAGVILCRVLLKGGRMEEGGLLESRANEAGRFLLCSVVDSEAKRYCVVFPEGKGILGG